MPTPNGIAVLATLQEGKEEECRAVLEKINSGEDGAVTINFARQNRTHLARFVILPDYDSGKRRQRLLFSAIFDGSREDFFKDMRDNTSNIDHIWRYCEGYSGANFFVQFAMQHDNKTGTFLKGHPHDTVQNIQSYLQLRDELCARFDGPPAQMEAALNTLPRHFALSPRLADLRDQWLKIWRSIVQIPNLLRLLRHGRTLIEAYNWVYGPFALDREHSFASVDKSGPCQPFAPGDEVVPCQEQDAVDPFLNREMVMNQMTVVTVNDPQYTKRQIAVLELIDAIAKTPLISRRSPIPTIHFGRWMMIDDNRRMLFLSNFDGSWQSYIGDFVDKASRGLNSFWGGSIGWQNATTLDIEFFKEGIRCHQTRASYFYCAYPHATVVNIEQARAIHRGYHTNVNNDTAREWLKHL